MIAGMTTLTLVHVLLSMVGILAGLAVVYGFLTSNSMSSWTLVFLVSTVATCVTAFVFPFNGFTPALGVGILTLGVVAAVIAARYIFRLEGGWRLVYVAGSVAALYLNDFVLVVQAFLKVPALHALAPNGSEPAFAGAQGAVLLAFIVAGIYSARRFRAVPA